MCNSIINEWLVINVGRIFLERMSPLLVDLYLNKRFGYNYYACGWAFVIMSVKMRFLINRLLQNFYYLALTHLLNPYTMFLVMWSYIPMSRVTVLVRFFASCNRRLTVFTEGVSSHDQCLVVIVCCWRLRLVRVKNPKQSKFRFAPQVLHQVIMSSSTY